MRGVIVAMLAAALIGPAAAQKIPDRHPDMLRATFVERWEALEQPLTFEQRWEPVRRLLVQQALPPVPRPRAEAQTPPAGSPGSVEPVQERPVRTRAIRVGQAERPAPAGRQMATCQRHRMRTVWYGPRWRCRR